MANTIPTPIFTLMNRFHKQLSLEEIESLSKNCHIILEECMIGFQTLGKLIFATSHSGEADLAENEMIGHLIRNMGEQGQDAFMSIQLAERLKEKRKKARRQ